MIHAGHHDHEAVWTTPAHQSLHMFGCQGLPFGGKICGLFFVGNLVLTLYLSRANCDADGKNFQKDIGVTIGPAEMQGPSGVAHKEQTAFFTPNRGHWHPERAQ